MLGCTLRRTEIGVERSGSSVDRPSAQALLAELGFQARLTIYLASAPGAGKTYRLLSDAGFQRRAGRRVAIGWVETKGRPDLEALAGDIPRIPPKTYVVNGVAFEDFDYEAAAASSYETIVLDELAHSNPQGAPHPKRWQDALALRAAGKSVLGAFNIQHLETVAPTAERIIGYPIREIVPLSLLKSADGVIALDVSSAVLESRLLSGRIVRDDDVDRATQGMFRPSTLQMLRELLLHTVDQLTVPVVSPAKTSTALAVVTGAADPRLYLRRVGALAEALDLAVEVTLLDGADSAEIESLARATADAVVIPPPPRLADGRLDQVRAAFVAVPNGDLAFKILTRPIDRELFIADPLRSSAPSVVDGARHPYGQTVGDRLRIGYGKLTIYLGSVAGSGKTYAMLDRAHDLLADGEDVVVGLVETHGRADTAAKLAGLEVLSRLPNGELDREAIVRRHPQVVLIDELAHTNEPGSTFPKRYDDVIAVLRQGISVMTTLNIQHLEGLGDAVERLTGTRVRETLPDSILELADDVIFIDVTPEVLRERLREGKIYPRERIDSALSNFFRLENLAALRELTVRELMRARRQRRAAPPFQRILLGVRARERDATLVERMGRLARRLSIELLVVHVTSPKGTPDPKALERLRAATKAAQGHFQVVEALDTPGALVATAADLDVIVVESPRTKPKLFAAPAFAVRLLRAGARELLVLSPK
jgi:two-component system sensor histidine kinase KdpD